MIAAVAIPLGADDANDTIDALVQAEAFISGFEGDPLLDNVTDILAGLRLAITREQAAPTMLAALKLVAPCWPLDGIPAGAEHFPYARTAHAIHAAINAAEGR